MEQNTTEIDEFKSIEALLHLGDTRYHINNLKELLENPLESGKAGLEFTQAERLKENLSKATSFINNRSWSIKVSPSKYHEDVAKELLNLKTSCQYLVSSNDSGSNIGIAINNICSTIDEYLTKYRSYTESQSVNTSNLPSANETSHPIPLHRSVPIFATFIIALLALDKSSQQNDFSTIAKFLCCAPFIALVVSQMKQSNIQR